MKIKEKCWKVPPFLHTDFGKQVDNQLRAGIILEGDLGEIVSLSWLTFPYFDLMEK